MRLFEAFIASPLSDHFWLEFMITKQVDFKL